MKKLLFLVFAALLALAGAGCDKGQQPKAGNAPVQGGDGAPSQVRVVSPDDDEAEEPNGARQGAGADEDDGGADERLDAAGKGGEDAGEVQDAGDDEGDGDDGDVRSGHGGGNASKGGEDAGDAEDGKGSDGNRRNDDDDDGAEGDDGDAQDGANDDDEPEDADALAQ